MLLQRVSIAVASEGDALAALEVDATNALAFSGATSNSVVATFARVSVRKAVRARFKSSFASCAEGRQNGSLSQLCALPDDGAAALLAGVAKSRHSSEDDSQGQHLQSVGSHSRPAA